MSKIVHNNMIARNMFSCACLLTMLMIVELSLAQKSAHHFISKCSDNTDKVHLLIEMDKGNCTITPKESGEKVVEAALKDHVKDAELISKENKSTNIHEISLSIKHKSSFDLFEVLKSKKNCALSIDILKNKPLDLFLKNNEGQSSIDLSGLMIHNLRIKSNDSEVTINHQDQHINHQAIDSLLIDVEMGSVTCNDLEKSKPKYIKANVGFGNLNLQFDRFKPTNTLVDLSVGAGNAHVSIKDMKKPIKIITSKSFLCNVKIPKSFKKFNEYTWVNEYFKKESEDLLTFKVDVSMGNIIFD